MSGFRLRVFAAVARHLSFTKAAQELFISQPAVTKHLHELEKQYGQRLLVRYGSRVALTEASHLLLAPAEAVAAAQQQLDDQLLALRDPAEAVGRHQLLPLLSRASLRMGVPSYGGAGCICGAVVRLPHSVGFAAHYAGAGPEASPNGWKSFPT
jgi:DNA-binding transcriptional LysR family regulator